MRHRLLALVAVLSLLGTVSASALPGLGDGLGIGALPPVKCSPDDVTPDGRVFPEPRFTATFLTFADFECGIGVLDQTHGDLIEITTLSKDSRGGAPVYDVQVTNEAIDQSEKRHLLIMSSIHGNEHAGREGAARVIEDMVDQRNGQEVIQQTLDQFVVHFVFPNPDGWINGDLTHADGGSNFTRANDGSRDLNRNFPVQGYLRSSNGTLDQPEGRGLQELLATYADLEHDPDDPDYRGWYLGTDNHGQGAKPVAASGLQIVGQFDYRKSERLALFADSIDDHIEGIALTAIEALNQATGGAVQPYEWGTLYDILGYSAAGSGIDYYNSPVTLDGTGVEGTGFATEMTASNLPFSNILTHPAEVNQMWVDTTRAINYAMFATAVLDDESYVFPVGGRAAYVLDPTPTSSIDASGFGPGNDEIPGNFTGDDPDVDPDFHFTHYTVSRMAFFDDLNRFADNPLDAVRVPDVLSGAVDLSAYDSLVLADDAMPEGADRDGWVAALRDFAAGGGNLIVTDGAAPILAEIVDGIEAADVSMFTSDVGFVDFGDRTLPLNEGLRGVASQTWDVIPVGYPDNAGAAPNWRVSAAAWETLPGAVTAGTNGTGQVAYGQADLGAGTVSFLGALLPEPTEEHFHPYGLQDYAVTYTGYTLLENLLDYSRGA